jgi:peptide/nickel transport system substrate-binding protein
MKVRTRTAIALLVVLCLALGLGLTGCGTATTTTGTGTEPVKGGTVTVGYEQEPAILNPFIESGDMMATKDVISNVLLGLIRIKPDFTYEPMLAEEIPEISNGGVTNGPFTVTWKLKKAAVWSDGKPITADDVKFTFDTIMSDKWKILSKSGYEDVEKCEVVDEKTVKFTYKKMVASYREWLSASYCILPKHALEGKDFDTVMNESIPVASGPFIFKEWKKGDHITLVRNEKYWGTKANLDSVVFKWVPDTNTELAQMKTGEVDVINPSPDPSLIAQMKAIPNVEVQANPGTIWEHFAFNTSKPIVNDVKVRQAIAYAIDRTKITQEVMLGQVKPLDSIFVPEQAAVYAPAWGKYAYDKAKAEALLKEAGYTKGADGIMAKGGTKLSLEWKTTAGNKGREKMGQIIQAQLKEVGIDLVLKFEEAQTFFGETTPKGNFVTGEWAWLASPDPSVTTLFSSKALPPDGQNYYRYDSAKVTQLITDADAEADPVKRADLSKQIATQMAEDVPLIPLYQRLSLLAFSTKIHGPANNATLEGVFWNMGDWWKEAPAAKTP